MLRTTFIAVIAVCVLVHAQGSDALIDSAVTLYETRHFNSENLLQSYDILFDIVEGEPQNQRAHYELSKVCFLLGDVAAEKKAKLKLFEEGRDYGKKAMKLEKASGRPGHDVAGTLSKQQLRELAEIKSKDLNINSIEAAERVIEGTARSMGIKVE